MQAHGSTEHRVHMTFEGAHAVQITCHENEDVVSAALRQGILLVSECRQGSCGACRGFLEEGRYDELLEHSEHALSEHDEDEGWILACRLRPRSDLYIDFDYPPDRAARLDIGSRSGRIVALDRVSTNVMRVLVRTLGAQAPLRWNAGQYVRLHLVQAGLVRPLSVANLSSDSRELEFYVRLVPGGALSQALKNMRGDGASVLVEGPFGTFELSPGCSKPVFVAGGTGLVPILAMLRHLVVADPGCQPLLIFGATAEEDLIAQNTLAQLHASCPGLTVLAVVAVPGPTWAGHRGTAVDMLRTHLAKVSGSDQRHFYLCGPSGMTQAARAVLAQFDVPEDLVHCESFTTEGNAP